MKKFLLFFFFCCMIPISCEDDDNSIVHDSLNWKEETENIKSKLQSKANQINTKILASFAKTRNISDYTYPDYYGGSYVTDDGKLAILIKGDFYTGQNSIMTVAESDDIIYIPCSYSYKELKDIIDTIEKFLYIQGIENTNITGASLLDKENMVVVYMEDCSEQAISEFKNKVISHPAIAFRSAGKSREESSVLSGSKAALGSSSSSGYGSFAFRAKESTGLQRKGMVTSGHVADVGTDVYSNGSYMGTCSVSKKTGQVDAAFVPCSITSFEPSNSLYIYGETLSTEVYAPAVGTSIILIGARSGVQVGEITSTYALQTFGDTNSYTLTNLTVANYESDEGDSGGLVFADLNWVYYTLGVHIGSNIYNDRFFCKAQSVLDALNIERY